MSGAQSSLRAMTHRAGLLLSGLLLLHTANGRFPVCHFHWELQRAEQECQKQLKQQPLFTPNCPGEWDNISCWQATAVGEVMTLSCPSALLHLFGKNGNISRNCTEDGWTTVYPSITTACWSNNSEEPNKLVFYRVVKILYTLGHSLSLIALLTSITILCLFRRLHCTRNYIHLNLFVSFILRAVAVLVKDAILFSHSEHADCSIQPSLVGCKTSLVFFNYFIMANFFWLLVEGLYLHTLLLVMHAYSTCLTIYMLIGWGIPSIFAAAWILCRIYLEDKMCWETNDDPVPKRVINWPIMASVIINFILFISIIRILVQKLRCSNVGGNDQSQYRRLAKSTLLLIPLFGVNYVVSVYMETADKSMEDFKILFDLGLGSFQGLVVAILYCFLNSEVQSELRRTWRSVSLKRCVRRDYRLHAMSVGRNGVDNSARFPRNSRAQSILQTETTVL
ncbi:vasoactive intestinal polypeptide receptor 2-like [Lampris incognitus]|uniref:vasoactive intestinal polypeptide receptor 2-like n=1 Tax=Lampris incognitus TaxID=2546036 RepID=UPI0024B5087B|nr:vasoactive intestinal polypeptide receptor 2-like [Lampris incognitus]